MQVHNETGALVHLTAQDGEGICHFVGLDPEADVATLPSHEFYATYRSATTKEQAAFMKANPIPPTDADALALQLAEANQQLADAKGKLASLETYAKHAETAAGEAEKAREKAAGDLAAEVKAHAATAKDLAGQREASEKALADAAAAHAKDLAGLKAKAAEADERREELRATKEDLKSALANNEGLNKDLQKAAADLAKAQGKPK